jgi:glyoxylase-like metal-dependent hydrolase (beta-lactamase superfamily II)
LAAAPRASRQVPGYFRKQLGRFEITALFDGAVQSRPQLLHGVSPQNVENLLEAAGFDPKSGHYQTSINAFCINTGDNLILVDAGVGTAFGDKGGRLAANLGAAGYRPEQIDTVLLTHLHSDHAFGLVDAAGRPLFPQATVRVHQAEAAYWLAPGAEERVYAPQRRGVPTLRAALAPYQAKGKFAAFASGEVPIPGLEAVLLAGHTPGHCGYRLGAGADGILFWGDTIHCQAVQFPRPEVSIDYDVDQAAAVATRTPLMAALAADRTWVAGAHLPFPGIGRLWPHGHGYAWIPALYEDLPTPSA